MTPQQIIQIGLDHHKAGRRDQAAQLYRQALAADANSHVAMFMLAALLLDSGDWLQAVTLLSKAAALAPAVPEYQNALGMALANSNRLPEAAAAFRRAIQLRSNYLEAYCGLGRTLVRLGEPKLAAEALQKAIAIKPDFAAARTELANALRDCGPMDQALAQARKAVQIDPKFAWGHNILGMIQHDLGDYDAAFASYKQAVALKPEMPEAYLNMAQVRRSCGQLVEAIHALRKAAQLGPRDPRPQHNLGVVLSDLGKTDEAIAAFSIALNLHPTFTEAHSALLLTLNYHPGYSPRQRFDAHRLWASQQAAGLTPGAGKFANDPNPSRRIRVGYVSPDLCSHPVSWFMENILQSHDRERFEVFVYSDVGQPDAVTQRLRALPLTWRDITGMGHETAAAAIGRDGVDILIDLAGHTRRGRLLMFARKPAPIQVSYLGYPNTTGLSAMDYRLTDAHADPAGESDSLHTEKLIRLPHGFLCYRPPAEGPPVAALPSAARNGAITFASFNNLAKLTDLAMMIWAGILRAVPGSRLLLKNRSLGDPQVAKMVAESMARCGITADRVDLRAPATATTDHLRVYDEVDIALDTFPYNGTTTTCEALWMGVPVVTFAGDTHAARVGTSILHQVGLSELAGQSPEDYVRIAVELAQDSQRLTQMRLGMRERLGASPLLKAGQITGDIETGYRAMWEDWCGRQG